MSDTSAKGKLTAYERWELPSFDPVKEDLSRSAAVMLPTAEEVEQMHKQAHDEGYQAGYAEGAQRAREEENNARKEQQNARDEAQRLVKIISQFDGELQLADQKIAQSLLELSLEIAKQILLQSLKVKPELLLNVVREAISELPHFSQHVHLILHPSDVELVRNKMGEQIDHSGWKLVEDAQMERGGCRVETAHSQIDASLATRWQRLVSSIGQDKSWLEA